MNFLFDKYYGTSILEFLILLIAGVFLYSLLVAYFPERVSFAWTLLFIWLIPLVQYISGISLFELLFNQIEQASFRYKIIPLFVFCFTAGYFYRDGNFRKTLTISSWSMLITFIIQLLI